MVISKSRRPARRGAGWEVQGSGPPPPATARSTCEIRLNPRTFRGKERVGQQ